MLFHDRMTARMEGDFVVLLIGMRINRPLAVHKWLPAHLPAWQEFNRLVGTDGTVGIWHETYAVQRGAYENVYVNMPRFGLAKAGTLVEARAGLQSAAGRLQSPAS